MSISAQSRPLELGCKFQVRLTRRSSTGHSRDAPVRSEVSGIQNGRLEYWRVRDSTLRCAGAAGSPVRLCNDRRQSVSVSAACTAVSRPSNVNGFCRYLRGSARHTSEERPVRSYLPAVRAVQWLHQYSGCGDLGHAAVAGRALPRVGCPTRRREGGVAARARQRSGSAWTQTVVRTSDSTSRSVRR